MTFLFTDIDGSTRRWELATREQQQTATGRHPLSNPGHAQPCVAALFFSTLLDVATAVEAIADRLVHQADVIALQGDSYRLTDAANEVTPR